MSTTTLLIIILLLFLFGGFVDVNGRGIGYGFGHVGYVLPGVLLVILIVLLVLGRI